MLSTKKEKNQQVQVFVRVRPLNNQEGINSCVDIKGYREVTLKHHATQKTFTFDKVFGPDSKQIDVYKMVAEPLVQEVIAGYNCTILAYGQTGTGKTYTMAGGNIGECANWSEDVHSGIIPRTLSHLFDLLRDQQVEHTVRISYIELYNEEIFDLLSPVEDNSKLKLYDDTMKKGSIIVQGLTETTVDDKAEVFRILEKGAEKRKVASTLMNAQSSRSHTVFCINVHTKENAIDGEDLLKTGKLYLVDLAGSENIKHSGVTEGRARETFSINQSLLTLGRCINKLTERSSHIPYRESKLTRLLQDSLGGRTKTTLIATVSPAICSYDESMNTLDYAHRAKNITNKPEVNQRLSKKTLLREYTEEIERLRKDLQATRAGKGIFVDEENYETIMRERNVHKAEMADKMGRIQVLQEEMANKEQLCEQLKITLQAQEQEVRVKVNTILALETQLQDALEQIHQLQQERDLSQYMVDKLSDTERQLQSTARDLLSVADTTTSDARKLHDKVDVLTDLTIQNKQVVEQHFVECSTKIENINDKLGGYDEHINTFRSSMQDKLDKCADIRMDYLETFQTLLTKFGLWSNKFNMQLTEIEASSQSFRVSSELTQCSMFQFFKDLFTNCQNEFYKFVTPNIEHMIDLAEQNMSNFNELLENSCLLIQQHQEYNNNFTEKFRNSVSDEKQITKQYFDGAIQSFDGEMKDNIKNQENLKQSYNLERNADLDTMINIILGMKKKAEKYDKVSDEQMNEHKQILHSINIGLIEGKRVCCNPDRLQNQFADHTVHLEKLNNENIHLLNDACISNQQNQQRLVHDANSLRNSQKKFLAVLEKHYNETEDVCIKEVNTLQDTADVSFTKHSSFLSQVKKEVEDVVNDTEEKMNDLCTRMNFSLDNIREAVEANDIAHREVQSVVSTEIDSCRDGMRRLFAGSLKEYKATGETPQRKTYRYPRMLAQTKPRDILIEEFHQTCQDIPEGDEKENESANINTSNTSKIPTLQPKQNTNIQKDPL